jgi:hypothetical protein
MTYFYYMGSSHMICNDRISLNPEPDLISIRTISRGRGDFLGVPFLSKFDGT